MQYSRPFLGLSLVVVLIAGFLGYGYFAKADTEAEGADKEETKQDLGKAMSSLDQTFGGKETAVPVKAGQVARGDLIQNVASQGRVHGYKNIELVNEIAGRLVQYAVRDGDQVKAGDIIAKIDERQYQLAFREAEANLIKAEAELLAEKVGSLPPGEDNNPSALAAAMAKLEKEYKSGLIAENDYSHEKLKIELQQGKVQNRRNAVIEARTVSVARVALDRAKLDLERCVVRAPFSGRVFEVQVTPGQYLSAGSVLCRLVNLDDLVVKAQVLESEMGSVRVGSKAVVAFTALPDLGALVGRVEAISPLVNSDEKTVEAIVSFKNRDGRVRPGMFSEVSIDAAVFQDRIMIPKTALLLRNKKHVVFKVNDESRADWIYVTIGAENNEFVEITKGELAEGDLVLVDNHFTMGHGALVRVVNKK
ncbi:efflux RND transporter periplasmic adaptor subunit [Acanthopleuribacter pedis]|uniref:Efflux RND transporter periplasmic adaptor subunit n=1 Tax=Acanthopleuribacter pedis TaxID=442870 RepID=A0A8J7QIZ7_9BACT|nr:efflux RND transporter periplasmic adaptor subunit [Acanthopleuribacter pedis]MBO1319103.1 efflux RND transporter periplasmic adaptor subunit [Acanthopleuribacter pedis]